MCTVKCSSQPLIKEMSLQQMETTIENRDWTKCRENWGIDGCIYNTTLVP